jgi:L-alanine-DL-glutamate epimerase-like enolase superfamily enzyme
VLNDDSTIDVPSGPGLGITIDEEVLKQFTLSEITLKAE